MSQVTKYTPPESAAATAPQADPMIAMIERIALDPKIPLDRLEKMLDMKERLEDRAREAADREAQRAYHVAMAACQANIPVVVKNKANNHTSSRYADLAAIEAQAMPIIHAHGFSVSFQPGGANKTGDHIILWEIGHSGGFTRSGSAVIPLDGTGMKDGTNKTDTQAFGSTMSYGRRYLLCMLFNISTGDDTDGNAAKRPDTISADQFIILRDKLEEANMDQRKLFLSFGAKTPDLETLEEFPAKHFDQAVLRIDNFIRAKAATQKEEAK